MCSSMDAVEDTDLCERQDSELDSETAYIMAFFVCEHFNKLNDLLQEIDEEYAIDPEACNKPTKAGISIKHKG